MLEVELDWLEVDRPADEVETLDALDVDRLTVLEDSLEAELPELGELVLSLLDTELDSEELSLLELEFAELVELELELTELVELSEEDGELTDETEEDDMDETELELEFRVLHELEL